MGAYVCAHGRTGCAYCPRTAHQTGPLPRCPVCNAMCDPGAKTCVRCAERGFTAPSLLDSQGAGDATP